MANLFVLGPSLVWCVDINNPYWPSFSLELKFYSPATNLLVELSTLYQAIVVYKADPVPLSVGVVLLVSFTFSVAFGFVVVL